MMAYVPTFPTLGDDSDEHQYVIVRIDADETETTDSKYQDND